MRRTRSLGVGLRALAALAASVVSPVPAAALITVGRLDTPGDARNVEVVGGLAYFADGESGLRVIDVSSPRAPVEVGALETPGNASGVAVVGGLAYVADGESGLRLISVSNPSAPWEVAALDTPGVAGDVEVVGGLAYVADGNSGLRVIDFGPEYSDADGDGAVNGRDNCPLVANAGQEDAGGIGVGSGPDGIGDACQCGDVDGDGRVTLADAVVVQRSLLQPPTATLAHPERCDVGGSTGCTLSVAVIIRRALLQPPTAAIEQVCAPAQP